MIKLFDEALRLIFFPVRWANAVTTWIQNVCSPDDTLKINNTCSPKEGSSLKLSVNMQRVLDAVMNYFGDFWITPDKLGEALDASCDKDTIIREGGRYKVPEGRFMTADDLPPVAPFTIQPVTTTSGSTVSLDYWKVYLPLQNVHLGRTTYALHIGTGTGEATSLGDGWYKINGITSGWIYLVEDSTSTTDGAKNYRVKFGQARVGANLFSHPIANVSFSDGVATITQNALGLSHGIVTPEIEHDGTSALDIRGTTSSSDSRSGFISASHVLSTKTWTRGSSKLQKNTGNTDNPTWVDVKDSSGNTQNCGVKLLCVGRVVRVANYCDYMTLREATFDKNGMLRTVGAEIGVFGFLNDNNDW